MSEDQHPVDEFLRRYAGTTPEPDPADVAYARTRLRAAIEQEKKQAGRRGRWPVAAWGTALLVVLIGVAVVFYGGRTTPAAAAIEEIASIAEATDPLTVSDTQYVYIHSEVRTLGVVSREGLGDVPYPDSHLVYVASSARETWLGDEGTLQTRTPSTNPASSMMPTRRPITPPDSTKQIRSAKPSPRHSETQPRRNGRPIVDNSTRRYEQRWQPDEVYPKP